MFLSDSGSVSDEVAVQLPLRYRRSLGRPEKRRRLAASRAAMRAGVRLRPYRDVVYSMPPFVTGDEDLARIAAGVLAAAQVG